MKLTVLIFTAGSGPEFSSNLSSNKFPKLLSQFSIARHSEPPFIFLYARNPTILGCSNFRNILASSRSLPPYNLL